MKTKIIVTMVVLYGVLAGVAVRAVDQERLWLPKKYQSVKPKLVAAAVEAEQTSRCKTVIAGEMISRKNTAEHYYFVITCRDKSDSSYNLSYLYPKQGQEVELVADQSRATSAPKTSDSDPLTIKEQGLTGDQVKVICVNALLFETQTFDGIALKEEQLSPPKAGPEGSFNYTLAFTALSDMASTIDYLAQCSVTKKAKVSLVTSLQDAGALTLCRDNLRAESILFGRTTLIEAEIEQQTASDGDFAFVLPFDSKVRNSRVTRFKAYCDVDREGDSDLFVVLQKAGALALCKDALEIETFLMKSVLIDEQALNSAQGANTFTMQLAFSAKDRQGNSRQFKAQCEVDEDGDAQVITEVDKDSIIAVCIQDLAAKTTKMLNVEVLEAKIPALIEDGDDYVALIPFNATNPSGTVLRYQGQCRVDGGGRSQIEIKRRRH